MASDHDSGCGAPLDLSADESVCREARLMFEGRWNRWNVARTLVATGVTAGLMGILALL